LGPQGEYPDPNAKEESQGGGWFAAQPKRKDNINKTITLYIVSPNIFL
jgi:hypothetical protein